MKKSFLLSALMLGHAVPALARPPRDPLLDHQITDFVRRIFQDSRGRMWFATHHRGVCRLKDGVFTSFGAVDGVEGEEAWDLFVDRAGNVWFPTEHFGVYRFNGRSFRRCGTQDGLLSTAVQCTYQDPQGRIWVGGYLGLHRQDGERFVNLTAELPWP